jgi:hypothetical protein
VTANEFRHLALSLPEAIEASHMGHPDFRVGKKIFATLSQDETRGMVKLSPGQQGQFAQESPDVFEPVPGGWGRQGATYVRLSHAKEEPVRRALITAWRNTAPKRLSRAFEEE